MILRSRIGVGPTVRMGPPHARATNDNHFVTDCNRNLPRAHLPLTPHSTPSTPLLPPLTLSAGESKVSRMDWWACLATHTLLARKGPKMASLYFWWPPRDSCCVAMVEPPVSYLESTVPVVACEIISYRIYVRWLRLFCLSCPIHLNTVSVLRDFHPPKPPPWHERRSLQTS